MDIKWNWEKKKNLTSLTLVPKRAILGHPTLYNVNSVINIKINNEIDRWGN